MFTPLAIAALALQFGRTPRATLHPDGIQRESDTDHTVMLTWLAIDIASRHPELGLDLGRLALLASIHDAPEVYAGDTDTCGGLTREAMQAKAVRESLAIVRLRREVPTLAAWIDAYERQEEPEARFIRYLDKITPKLTHALNGCAAIRKRGESVEWLRKHHKKQGAELAARYPEFAGVLGPLFEEAARTSEACLETHTPTDTWSAS